MGKQEMEGRGPIWRDVGELAARFEQRWGGIWVLSVRLDPGRGRRGHLFVLCERTASVGRAGAFKQTRASWPYPTSDGISMPSLMCRLLWEVNERLEADCRLAQRQASF
jgi:hypothetical protein